MLIAPHRDCCRLMLGLADRTNAAAPPSHKKPAASSRSLAQHNAMASPPSLPPIQVAPFTGSSFSVLDQVPSSTAKN